jgi:hypothetical protein
MNSRITLAALPEEKQRTLFGSKAGDVIQCRAEKGKRPASVRIVEVVYQPQHA